MSIIIKGMEMPKNCRECPFYYPYICMARDENITEDCNPVKSRDKDCPLIELPDIYIDISKAFMTELTDKVCRKEGEDG